MRTSLRLAPLAAAAFLSVPAVAAAQEAEPPAAVRTMPDRAGTGRVAIPRPPAEPARAAEPAAPVRPQAPAAPEVIDRSTPRATAAEQRGQGRGSGRTAQPRDRGRGNGGWRPPAGRSAAPVYPRGRVTPAWVGPRAWYTRPSFYDPYWAHGVVGWNPLFYAPWGLMWGTSGYWGYPGYPGYAGATTFDTGAVRLKMRPRDAEVWVDGYYAGRVDDFDGVFQSLRLAPGGHQVEVRMPGYQTQTFDIHIQPNRTLTITEDLRTP